MTRKVWCLLSLLWLGCDPFGRALVASGEEEPRTGTIMCVDLAVACDPIPARVTLVAPPAPGSQLASCSPSVPCVLPPSADATQRQSLTGCALTATAPVFLAGQLSLSCMHADVTVPAEVPTLLVRELIGEQTELSFTAEQPTRLELSHAQLRNVRITLRGPITLELRDESLLSQVEVTQLGDAAASVALIESSAVDFSVVGLRGEFRAARAGLNRTTLFAAQVELETTSAEDLTIQTDKLLATALRGKRLLLDVGIATISSAQLQKLTLQRCERALITSSTIDDSQFAACTDRLRLDHGTVRTSMLVGRIESSVMTLQHNAFAGAAATELESWRDSLLANRYCAELRSFTVSTPSSAGCNVCPLAGAASSQLFCTVAQPDLLLPGLEPSEPLPGEGLNPGCPQLDEQLDCAPVPVNENPF
jgi:hypothetical protein